MKKSKGKCKLNSFDVAIIRLVRDRDNWKTRALAYKTALRDLFESVRDADLYDDEPQFMINADRFLCEADKLDKEQP
jgi:hypothetical protein